MTPATPDLQGRTILITGAGDGLGAALARAGLVLHPQAPLRSNTHHHGNGEADDVRPLWTMITTADNKQAFVNLLLVLARVVLGSGSSSLVSLS